MSLGATARARALTRSVERLPHAGSIDAFGAFLQALSDDLAAVRPGVGPEEAVELVERKAEALGLDCPRIHDHIATGLRQQGSLGPDEAAEYSRNITRVCPQLAVDGNAAQVIERVFHVFVHLGRRLANELDHVVRRCGGGSAVFIGTDAEFLKIVYDVLADSPRASQTFYLSRLSLLSDEERHLLSVTREATFGPDLTTRVMIAGLPTYRDYTWMDNGLVASQLFYLIADVHNRLRRTARPQTSFEELFVAAFLEELRNGTLQARRQAHGWLTLFGTPQPDVDRLILTSMEEHAFADRCMSIARRFEREILADDSTPMLIELGASGTQACLLFGSLAVLDQTACDRDDTRRGLSVWLFTPDPSRWEPSGTRFVVRRATPALALATETVKTFCSDFDGQFAAPPAPSVVAADQQLVAYLKQLAFHRAALEVRSACR
jgi:hypothetical protein